MDDNIHIVTPSQTILLYHNPSVWLDMQDASSWDRNPLDMVSNRSAISVTKVSLGIIAHMY